MPKKIAVVGLGWLGFPVGLHFIAKGFQVVGTTRSEEKKQDLATKGIHSVCWDSKSGAHFPVNAIFDETDICLLNFPPGKFTDLDEYRAHLVQVVTSFPVSTRFIFISTTGVYPENMEVAREDNYQWSMNNETNHIAKAEEGLSELLGNRLSIIRMAGLIGPNRHPAKFFAGRTDISNGNAPVNLIHLNDCIQLIDAVVSKECWGEIINGCATDHPSRGAYYSYACEKFGFEKVSFLVEGKGKFVDNTKSKSLMSITYQMDSPFDYWDI
jgi:nucleoside-diphosphate-sugar epimerase